MGECWIEFLSTEEWRRLHNEELYDLLSPPNNIKVIKERRMRQQMHVARMGQKRGAYRVLVGVSEGRRSFGRPRHRWDNTVKLGLQK
jgi:hypothetical protein